MLVPRLVRRRLCSSCERLGRRAAAVRARARACSGAFRGRGAGATAGIAGDAGETGVLVNSANFLETGTFWDMQHCEPEDGESADLAELAAEAAKRR